jgi:hypothetical protein
VETFDDCLDMCSNRNYFTDNDAACQAASYWVGVARPVNCWGTVGGNATNGQDVQGQSVAFLIT